MSPPRVRQLVIAANSLDTADTLQSVLGLGEPFPDPGVAEFGLVNAVFALGDQFLEIVVPTEPKAPARRFIDRGRGRWLYGDIPDRRSEHAAHASRRDGYPARLEY